MVLLSADLHYAVVFRLRPTLYEFSASPLQNIPLNTWITRTPGEELLFSSQLRYHFGVVDVHSEPTGDGGSKKGYVKVAIWAYNYFFGNPHPLYELTLTTEDLRVRT